MSTSVKHAICNEAAAHIGAGLFSDALTAQTETQKSILAFYDQAAREVLDLRPWSGAARRAVLAELQKPDERLHEGFNKFALPADFVRMGDETSCGYRRDWYIEEGAFYASASEVIIRYNSSETEATWSPHMIALIGVALGLKVSLTRKDSQSQTERLRRTYQALSLKTAQLEGKNRSSRIGDPSRVDL